MISSVSRLGSIEEMRYRSMPSTSFNAFSRSRKLSPVVRPKSPVLTPVMTISFCPRRRSAGPSRPDRRQAGCGSTRGHSEWCSRRSSSRSRPAPSERCACGHWSRRPRKAGQRIGLAGVDLGLARQFDHPFVQIALVVVAQYQRDPFDTGYLLRFQLGVAARDGDERLRVAAMDPPDQVAAFLVGVFGDRTAVDDADVGFSFELTRSKPSCSNWRAKVELSEKLSLQPNV